MSRIRNYVQFHTFEDGWLKPLGSKTQLQNNPELRDIIIPERACRIDFYERAEDELAFESIHLVSLIFTAGRATDYYEEFGAHLETSGIGYGMLLESGSLKRLMTPVAGQRYYIPETDTEFKVPANYDLEWVVNDRPQDSPDSANTECDIFRQAATPAAADQGERLESTVVHLCEDEDTDSQSKPALHKTDI